ncbi:hypothetical protein [Virgisporangium aliadipatigenens]|nr:hypothetical protein [Virgisporangium aliadipatigenens]
MGAFGAPASLTYPCSGEVRTTATASAEPPASAQIRAGNAKRVT